MANLESIRAFLLEGDADTAVLTRDILRSPGHGVAEPEHRSRLPRVASTQAEIEPVGLWY
jgi:hypothetical protein